MRRQRALAAVLAVLAVAGCSGATIDGEGIYGTDDATPAPQAKLSIHFTNDGSVDDLAANAMADIQQYWKTEFPELFDQPYKKIDSFYSIDPEDDDGTLPCVGSADNMRGNAMYCPATDSVLWDRTDFFPVLTKNFGDYAVPMVLAHETGHAIQDRTHDPGERTISIETQADCYSGAFTRAAFSGQAPHFPLTTAELDHALGGMLAFADQPGEDPTNPLAHGNAFDRISAFQDGFAYGAARCADPKYFSDHRPYTELPYSASAHPKRDEEQKGNSPYQESVRLGVKDLTEFWAQFKGWKPLKDVVGLSENSDQDCGGTPIDKALIYCTADNTIYFDAEALPKLHDIAGDFAVETMLAVAYAFAARHDFGQSTDDQNGLLGAICYAGAYTHSVFAKPQVHYYQLSPGDLDEALQALLVGMTGGSFNGLQDTTGFQRVRAFQVGVKEGFSGNDPDQPGAGCRQYP
ncbi:MAG TPA: neutral zinc metallopeptidase [Mycobacteriales bacterium]|nr:neutral zinc metallopeptidase [Mycobacteriales bacterium]